LTLTLPSIGVIVKVSPDRMIAAAASGLNHPFKRICDAAPLPISVVIAARSYSDWALSPAMTLERGYAVVQTSDGAVVRAADDVPSGAALRIRVADGELPAHRD